MTIDESILRVLTAGQHANIINETSQPLISVYDETVVTSRYMDMNYRPQWGVSEMRDATTTANGGTVAETGGELRVRTGATANAVAEIQTLARAAYVPGSVGQSGLGIRIPDAPANDQDITWGQFDSDNGIGWGWDADGIYVFTRSGGIDTKVRIDDFNVDKMDGNGPSGMTQAELIEQIGYGLVCHIDWTWYGYGSLVFSVISAPGAGLRQRRALHVINVSGLSVTDPNQPLTVRVINGASGGDVSAYIGGRQFSVFADLRAEMLRQTPADRNAVALSTSWLPVLAVRRKSTFGPSGRANSVRVFAQQISALCGSNIELKLVVGGTVAGGSWGNFNDIDPSETACEMNNTLTSHTGGRKIDHAILAGGQGATLSALNAKQTHELGNSHPLVLHARAFAGTPSLIKSVLQVEERW